MNEPLPWIVRYLWLIPFLPLLAAGLTALMKQKSRKAAATLVIGAIAISFLLSLWALSTTMKYHLKTEAGPTAETPAASTQPPHKIPVKEATVKGQLTTETKQHETLNHMVLNF